MIMDKQINIFANNIEPKAIDQFMSAIEQDFSVSGALMPDVHTGYSLPIGAIVATKGVIVPAWIGFDQGCGLCALKLKGIKRKDIEKNSKQIFDLIYENIPVGRNINKTETNYHLRGLSSNGKRIATQKNYKRALCSLGGGNHFIEIGYDEDNSIWIIVHSGSRGVGHGIASHYMTIASSSTEMLEEEFDKTHETLKKFNPDQYDDYKAKYVKKYQSKAKPKEGHYGFDVDSQNGKDYIKDLNWCLGYALNNRFEMIKRVFSIISEVLNIHENPMDISSLINRNHNHAVERDGLWIHRKGATHAEEGMMGVIPGNMRDGSFIVRGKGNPDSLYSSSHGAGRVMSRTQANRELNLEEFKSTMEGVVALVQDTTLDESPSAYKDIFEVMRLQSDLVEVIAHVKPLINIKG